MRRWILMLLFVAFTLGVYQEMAEAGCAVNEPAACCVCLCHTPMAGTGASQIAASPLTVQAFALSDSPVHDQQVVKSIFNPPRY
jgi:hypothetical protein